MLGVSSFFKHKFSYSEVACFFIVVFCCYFMTSIMSISPIYGTTLIGLFMLLIQVYYKRVSVISLFVYGTCILYALWYLFDCLIISTELHAALVSFFFALYYIFADLALCQIDNKKKMQNIIKLYFLFFTIYYVIDLILRLKTAQTLVVPEWMQANPILKFYLLKFGGLTGDSNTLGTFCVANFSVLFFSYLRRIIQKKYLALSFVMAVISCSRAAIVSCLAILLFWYFFYNAKLVIKIGMVFFGIFLSFFVFMLFLNDGSFLTKLDILNKTYKFLQECDVYTFLFGLGPNQSFKAIGCYAHNIWSIMLLEYGFVGLVLFLLMMIFISFDVGKYFFIVVIPYFLVSLSFKPIFLQFLFVAFALIKHIDRIFPKISNEHQFIRNRHKMTTYFFNYNFKLI